MYLIGCHGNKMDKFWKFVLKICCLEGNRGGGEGVEAEALHKFFDRSLNIN